MAKTRLHIKSFRTIQVLLTLYIMCFIMQPTYAEIRTRSSTYGGGHSANSVNTNNHKSKTDGHTIKMQTDESAKTSSSSSSSDASSASSTTSTTSSTVNTDFMDKMSWKCANNASCLYSLASGILSSYRRGETVKLGFVDLVKLPATHKPKSNLKSKSTTSSTTTSGTETGRGISSSFVDFISGNAIRIPVGPMVFSVQRAEDDDNYIEVALLKKASSTARLGDGGGGGGGGGHGMMHRIKEHKEKDDKKQMQMYIPMYLAATTFGWTMVAAKAVGLLTLKALAISKIAFIVAAMVLMKKLMDNASDKMMYQYPEHSPYMMPYSMDYGMHSMAAAPAEMTAADMYGGGMPIHAAMGQLAGHPGHSGFEHLAAESSVHQNIAEAQNNTQVLAALNAAGLGQKVKREDSWFGRMAAAAAADVVVDEYEKRQKFKTHFFGGIYNDYDDEEEEEEDDIFNEEESIKDTLQFLASSAARRPLVYNYLNPHSYYRQ